MKSCKREYIDLYTVQHPNVLDELVTKKKYVASINSNISESLEYSYKNMAKYLSKKTWSIVRRPVFCFVAVESKKRDFTGFNFNQGDIILHLKVPIKYCAVYDFIWFDYFEKYNILIEKIISKREDMNNQKNLHCCLPYIKQKWLVDSEQYKYDVISPV